MNHLLKFRTLFLNKCSSSSSNMLIISKNTFLHRGDIDKLTYIGRTYSFCSTSGGGGGRSEKDSDYFRRKYEKLMNWSAQQSLLKYLQTTRNLPFSDAEHMSRNCPWYLNKLLKRISEEDEEEDEGGDLLRLIDKHFMYHPPNEFEVFYESLGLKLEFFRKFLPRDKLFLSEDEVLMKNYNVLVEYGFKRGNLGKIFMEERKVFKFGDGVLLSKLKDFEDMGLISTSVTKIVGCSPSILVGGLSDDIITLIKTVKGLGLNENWFEGCLSESNSYNWGRILGLIKTLREVFCSEEELVIFLKKCPGCVFNCSGDTILTLIAVLLKCGVSVEEISLLLLQFPQENHEYFLKNLKRALLLLTEIKVEADYIGSFFCSHLHMLGSSPLMERRRIQVLLDVDVKGLYEIVKNNPNQLKDWYLEEGTESLPQPISMTYQISQMEKANFLLNLGFTKDSDEMETMLMTCHGKGEELEERFECYLNAGLSAKEVTRIVKKFPKALCQSRPVIEEKLDFLVNVLGYPISILKQCPLYIQFSLSRVKQRFLMLHWLKQNNAFVINKKKGPPEPNLTLSSIITITTNSFVEKYVKCHPAGLEIWEKLKKGIDIGITITKLDKHPVKESKRTEKELSGQYWNAVMVKHLIEAISSVEKRFAVITKWPIKDKWKLVADLMKEKGHRASSYQCQDKFGDLRWQYNRLHKILGKEKGYSVVVSPSLLDSMPELSFESKDEVRQMLGSKTFLYHELYVYLERLET